MRVRFGPAVADPWLAGLDAELRSHAAAWELRLEESSGLGGTAVVVRSTLASGGSAYLKLTPDPAIALDEARALDHWATTGRVPRVLQRDEARGALLLEAIDGTGAVFHDDIALDQVAALATALHDEPPVASAFPSLAERVLFLTELWEERFAGEPVLESIRRAGDAALLLATDERAMPVLLHGDLHPGNVFVATGGKQLIAFDPRPCVGDGAFDLIDWVLRRTDDPAQWEARAARLAERTGCDPDRLWQWCRAYAAPMAALWSRHGGAEPRAVALRSIAV